MARTIQFFPLGENVHFDAKYFHCSCHATWPPCKTSIAVSNAKKVSNCTKARPRHFNPIHTGLFWIFSDRGGGGFRPPSVTSRIFKQSQ